MPIDYSKGKIYTIRYLNDDSLIYVGSTVNALSYRFSKHKECIYNENNSHYHLPLYEAIRKSNNLKAWYIELYESFQCNTREELRKREGEVIREIGTLNKNIAGRTIEEWKQDNIDELLEKRKEYYNTKRDEILEKKKEYYEKNETNIKQRRQIWRQENKDIIQTQNKEWYERNKEQYLEKLKETKVKCECGSTIRKDCLNKHRKTKKHLDLMNQQQAATN